MSCMKSLSLFTTIVMVMLLSACGVAIDNAAEAQRDNAATQVAALIATTTLEAARLHTTLDYTVTRASLASTQGSFLELTLETRGTPASVLQEFQAQIFSSFATATPTAASDQRLSQSTSVATQLVVTPLIIPTSNEPVVDPNAPRLENIVTSTGVDGDDCAVGETNVFTTATPSIYVVARAVNVLQDTRLGSRWNLNGEQVISYEFTPNFTIENACIWFFMDQADVIFTPGEWTVQLDINGSPAALPINFTIRE